MSKAKTNYVCQLSSEQVGLLRGALTARGWEFSDVQYAHWRAAREKTNVTAYLSGKMVAQGAGVEDFILYTLEPEVLKEAKYGYETETAAETAPEQPFVPHAGIDESGKGDYFGPLVISCVFVGVESRGALVKLGVRDSKAIKNDKLAMSMAGEIRNIVHGSFATVVVGQPSYNRLYEKTRNLNRMLAWGHARALEDLLTKVPECGMAISDKFGDSRLVSRALMEKGAKIELIQKVRAEADIAVAAASILARAEFLRRLGKLSEEIGVKLPKGAGHQVDEAAAEILARHGAAKLDECAKLHFKNTTKVCGAGAPPPQLCL